MTYNEITDVNVSKEGIDGILCYVAKEVTIFFPMLLFSFFMIILVGGYMAQKKLLGKGNFFGSMAVAGFMTTLLALAMTLSDCLINYYILGICITVTIISVALMFLQGQEY